MLLVHHGLVPEASWEIMHEMKSTLTSGVVENASLGEHSVVLDLRLAKGRAIAADDHELALSAAQCLERALVTQGVLAGLHNQSKA